MKNLYKRKQEYGKDEMYAEVSFVIMLDLDSIDEKAVMHLICTTKSKLPCSCPRVSILRNTSVLRSCLSVTATALE